MISAIVAVDNNWGIGCNGGLLERIPEDMKYFKELTANNLVIMGRKTWDSLPSKPLPCRTNIIISSTLQLDYIERNGSFVSVTDMKKIKTNIVNGRYEFCPREIFIIGGGQIYEQLLPYCDQVYVTKIFKEHENVDTYFPNLDKLKNWMPATCSEVHEYENILYQFWTYKRV